MNRVEDAVVQIIAFRKRTRNLYILHILLYGVAVLIGVAGLHYPCVILGIANVCFYLLYVRKQNGKYSDLVAQANIRFGLCAPLENVQFTGRQGMPLSDYMNLGLLPVRETKGGFMSWQGFSGNYQELLMKGCEISTHYPVDVGGKTEYKFLTGTLLTAEGDFQGEGDWLLIHYTLLNAFSQAKFVHQEEYQEAECPLEDLSNDFWLYSKGQVRAMPRPLAERIRKLHRKVSNIGAIRLAPNVSAVYLTNRFYTGRTRIGVVPTADQLKNNPLPERDFVWDLFRYWKGQK